jgi:hypothetical protein
VLPKGDSSKFKRTAQLSLDRRNAVSAQLRRDCPNRPTAIRREGSSANSPMPERCKKIADRLDRSVETVRTHLHRIYEKLHVRSRTEAVVKMFGRGASS